MTARPPPVETRTAPEDELLLLELTAWAVEEQAAVVRELARRAQGGGSWGAEQRTQLVEAVEHLGCRMLEAAACLSEAMAPAPHGGDTIATSPFANDRDDRRD